MCEHPAAADRGSSKTPPPVFARAPICPTCLCPVIDYSSRVGFVRSLEEGLTVPEGPSSSRGLDPWEASNQIAESMCGPLEVSLLSVLDLVGRGTGETSLMCLCWPRAQICPCSVALSPPCTGPAFGPMLQTPVGLVSAEHPWWPRQSCRVLSGDEAEEEAVCGGCGLDQPDEPPEAPFPCLPADSWPQLSHCPQRPTQGCQRGRFRFTRKLPKKT